MQPRGTQREQAVRDHARRRIEPGEQDGHLADRATGVRRPLAARATSACPAGENVQQWLYDAEEGGLRGGWRQIMEDNPFPAVMGRVCYRPCEAACNRATLDEAVGINSVERFLGDEALKHGWTLIDAEPITGQARPRRRRRPLGALRGVPPEARLGHEVTVRDAGPAAGGMMRFGIPTYRLPRDVLDAEIQRIVDLGVTLELVDHGDGCADGEGGRLVRRGLPGGGGTHRQTGGHPGGTPRRNRRRGLAPAKHGGGEQPLLGRRVAVYGGGNTAMDVARTAKRLGADGRGGGLPPDPGTDAGARDRGQGGPGGRRADEVAVHDQVCRRGQAHGSRRWGSTRRASRSRPASSRTSRRTRWCSRSARRPIWRWSDVPDARSTTASSRSGPN